MMLNTELKDETQKYLFLLNYNDWLQALNDSYKMQLVEEEDKAENAHQLDCEEVADEDGDFWEVWWWDDSTKSFV